MKYGIVYANTGFAATGEGAKALATTGEELGFESLWTVEHVVVPAGYKSTYPYSPSGKMPGTEENPIPDPLIWLTYAGAVTSKINLATGILILPQRNTVVLAKELATLDALTGGRFILGIGIGWLREEFDCIGVDFAQRAAITDEHVEALRTIWREDSPTFHGKFSSFDNAKSYPKPARGTIPVVVGGHTPAAARRAGRLGDGFFPASAGVDQAADLFAIARKTAADSGRDPEALELTLGGAPTVESVEKAAAAGAARFVVPGFGGSAEHYRDLLGAFADNVIAKVG